jgi:tetratricopeptide (TPR) repeat protein
VLWELSNENDTLFRRIRRDKVRISRRRIGLEQASGAGQQKVERGETFRDVEAAASGHQNEEREQGCALRKFSDGVHNRDCIFERLFSNLLMETRRRPKVAGILRGHCGLGKAQLKDYIVQLDFEMVKLKAMKNLCWNADRPGVRGSSNSVPEGRSISAFRPFLRDLAESPSDPAVNCRAIFSRSFGTSESHKGGRAWMVLGFILALLTPPAFAADTNSTEALLASEFQRSQKEFQTNTNGAEAAWKFGRACFDMSTLQKDSSAAGRYAEQGIDACRLALALAPNSAAAHYYLGMDIAQLADTKHNLSALRMVKDMEREFLAAKALDKHFDYAGPSRNLGLLYRDAPSIVSVGSRMKARQYLEEAVELAPEFPENQLNLIESYLKWDYQKEAQRQYGQLQKMWPDAQKKFTGVAWQMSWTDWNKRLDAIRRKLEKNPRNESPHSQ